MPETYLHVALPVPLRRLFDYLPPTDRVSADQLQPGVRVTVPFGKQELVGVLVSTGTNSDIPVSRLKKALSIIDQEPLLPPSLLNLLTWSASYYQHPLGEALLSTMPTKLRLGESAELPGKTFWRLSNLGKGLPDQALKRSPKQAALLKHIQTADLSQQAIKALGFSGGILRSLYSKQLIEPYLQTTDAVTVFSSEKDLLKEKKPKLNKEQKNVLSHILSKNTFEVSLLQGVTGSGKTEVYMQAIEGYLSQQKQILILVPEIGLTPQLLSRFEKRFDVPITTFHSGMNNTKRKNTWVMASKGQSSIIIGTRSAVFIPIPKLSMIIVDEEHDDSFKQQDGFKYNARDVAIVRAKNENIPVILGSATPSLESLNNAITGRYKHLSLRERAGKAVLPNIHLLDISRQKTRGGFSEILLDMIREELHGGNQVLVFLNRRGYAPVLLCPDCGWVANCSHCDAKLTVHKNQKTLRCHHCDWSENLPRHCLNCQSPHLQTLGSGTQRSEELLQELFSEYPIIRIDRDSTSGKDSLQLKLDQIKKNQAAILIGTQMLAKGHHFPGVTLAAILDADAGLHSADFRGTEKFGQILIQVAGRAGRDTKVGHVAVQSRCCDHPLMNFLAKQDYDGLARQLLKERELQQLPPYRQLAIFRTESSTPQAGENFLRKIRKNLEHQLRIDQAITMVGPLPALMEKRANRYRQELVFYSTQRAKLQEMLCNLSRQMESEKDAKKLRWTIDVDPVSL